MKDSKCLLVVGASSDVGLALIRQVAGIYDTIFAQYNSKSALIERLQAEGKICYIIPVKAYLADVAQVAQMLEVIKSETKVVDHIVHLAAPKTTNAKYVKRQWAEYEEAINVSVRSFVEITRAFLPAMQKQAYGKIIAMLTSCVVTVPPKYQAPYVSSKYMLLGLVNALAAEHASKGVMVNAVSPDMIETNFLSDITELIVKLNDAANPLGRNLTVADVIPAFEYLLSDGADAVSGQNIVVAGGKIF